MCNCLDETLNQISKKVKETIPLKAIDYKCDWKGKVFRFDGGCGVGLYVDYEYRNVKTNGEPYKNKNKDSSFVAMSFCPFCGESLEKKNNHIQ